MIRCNREGSSKKGYLGPKIQQYFVRLKREFVITVIVITEFDCICEKSLKENIKFHFLS